MFEREIFELKTSKIEESDGKLLHENIEVCKEFMQSS